MVILRTQFCHEMLCLGVFSFYKTTHYTKMFFFLGKNTLRRLSVYFSCKGLSPWRSDTTLTQGTSTDLSKCTIREIKRVNMLPERVSMNNFTAYTCIFLEVMQHLWSLIPKRNKKHYSVSEVSSSPWFQYSSVRFLLQLAHNCFGYLKHKVWCPFSVKKDLSSSRIDAAEPGLLCSIGFSTPFPQWGPCRSLTRQGRCRSCSTQTQPKEPTWKLSSIIVLWVKEWGNPWDHKLALLTLVFLWLFCS